MEKRVVYQLGIMLQREGFLPHFLNELRNNLFFGKMTEVPVQFC